MVFPVRVQAEVHAAAEEVPTCRLLSMRKPRALSADTQEIRLLVTARQLGFRAVQ